MSLRVAGTERTPEVKQGRAAGGKGGGVAKSQIVAAPKPQVSLVSAGNGKLTKGFSQWGAQSDSFPSKRSFWLLSDEQGGQDNKNGVRTCIGGSCCHLTHTETHAQFFSVVFVTQLNHTVLTPLQQIGTDTVINAGFLPHFMAVSHGQIFSPLIINYQRSAFFFFF